MTRCTFWKKRNVTTSDTQKGDVNLTLERGLGRAGCHTSLAPRGLGKECCRLKPSKKKQQQGPPNASALRYSSAVMNCQKESMFRILSGGTSIYLREVQRQVIPRYYFGVMVYVPHQKLLCPYAMTEVAHEQLLEYSTKNKRRRQQTSSFAFEYKNICLRISILRIKLNDNGSQQRANGRKGRCRTALTD